MAPDRLVASRWSPRRPPPTRSSPTRPRRRAGDGLVVVAEHQTAGRGRLDRTWETPARCGADVLGAAAADVAAPRPGRGCRCSPGTPWPRRSARAGTPPRVKWPNDVLLGERKVAGILVERVDTPDGAGRGRRRRAEHRHDHRGAAGADGDVAAAGAAAPTPDRADLLLALLAAIRGAYDAWQGGGDGRRAAGDGVRRRVRDGRPPGARRPARRRRARGTAEAVDRCRAGWSGPDRRRRAATIDRGAGGAVARPSSACDGGGGAMIRPWPSRRSC